MTSCRFRNIVAAASTTFCFFSFFIRRLICYLRLLLCLHSPNAKVVKYERLKVSMFLCSNLPYRPHFRRKEILERILFITEGLVGCKLFL